jgi:hypothetical protein
MKTTIEMPDDLFRTAKSVAAIRGQTLKQLITTAIERELAANQTILRNYPPKTISAGSMHSRRPMLRHGRPERRLKKR